jgi:hypothetical protein
MKDSLWSLDLFRCESATWHWRLLDNDQVVDCPNATLFDTQRTINLRTSLICPLPTANTCGLASGTE